MIDLLDFHEAINILIKADNDDLANDCEEMFGKRFYPVIEQEGIVSAIDWLSEKDKNKFVEYILDKYQKEKIQTDDPR